MTLNVISGDQPTFKVTSDDFIDLTNATKNQIKLQRLNFGTTTTLQYSKNLSSFLDDNKNAITRSFKSVGGKGLAGFIDNINFDWYNGVTWDVSPGVKAPKMCKVTMGFTPIHDIAPGLDASGHNRAPIYPVGPYAYKK